MMPSGEEKDKFMVNRRFAGYAWGVLALNVIVIIWGAFVRATGSGAGCGSNWPLCHGVVIPQANEIATVIEFSHRVTSGLALISVIVMVIWGFRAFPKGHIVRKGVIASFALIILEALLGAALVLLEYTAFNVSIARAYWMAGHLVSTFLLLAALTLTAWWARGGARIRLRGQGAVGATYWLAVAGMMLLGMSGAVTALGDTLTIAGGISPQDNAIVATLVDLRVFHPLIAVGVFGLTMLAIWMTNKRRPAVLTQQLGWAILALFVIQLLAGALNVSLKAPVWLQMVHLLLTSVIWILIVLFGAVAMADTAAASASPKPAPGAVQPA
jgi:heme A synthase